MVMACAELLETEALLFLFLLRALRSSNLYIPACHKEEEFESDRDRHNQLPEKEREKEKKASWQKIFDLRPSGQDFLAGDVCSGCLMGTQKGPDDERRNICHGWQ